MTTTPPLVLVESEGAIATVTLNRPERHNSLIPELLGDLLDAFQRVGSDTGASVVVFQAAGRSFSTGGDVGGFFDHLDSVEEYAGTTVGLLHQVIVAMLRLPKPIVAAVHGLVTGGSLGLVLASDVVLVAPEASFTPWYREVGFAPDGGWTALLPRVVGPKRAADVLLRDATISADQAVAWGLAAAVVPGDRIHREARTVAAAIAAAVPGFASHAKARLHADIDAITAALEDERRRFLEQIVTPEVHEAMARFLGRD